MNRLINAISIALLIPSAFLAFSIDNELEFWPEKSASNLPYQSQFFTVILAIILVFNLFRVYQKWSIIRAFWKVDTFKLRVPAQKPWYNTKMVGNLLEIVFALAFGYFFTQLGDLTKNLGSILLFFGLENLFYIIWVRAKKLYAVALNKKALILLDRQFQAYYFHGLRKIEKDFDHIYFTYMDDLQMKFPLKSLDEEGRKEVMGVILESINKDKVYVDQDLV